MTDRPRVSPLTLMIVVAGGAAGVALRALVSVPLGGDAHPLALPAATLVCNLLGSFLLGVVAARLGDRHPRWRAFAGNGVLGGFTTYSAFAVQSIQTFTAAPVVGVLLVTLSLGAGVAAAAWGLMLGGRPRRAARPEVSP